VEFCGQDVNIFLFGDDAKLFNHIRMQDDEVMLRKCIDRFVEWAEKWLIKINLKIYIKLSVMNKGHPENESSAVCIYAE